jgi:pyruvate formate lyase activating enzyme
MGIKGFQGTSLLDFPGRVASLIFWGGCNLTCPFCHNPPLVLTPGDYPDIAPDDLLEELQGRQPFIDGVVLSGGEPTLDPDLPAFMKRLKDLGLAVKLDTNGLAPGMVRNLLNQQLIDYLAIDLKASPDRYTDLHSTPVEQGRLNETVAIAQNCEVPVEYRTTCVPGWVDENMIHAWGERIAGASTWALQQFHAEHALDRDCRQVSPFPPDRVRTLAAVAEGYVAEVIVRGL